MSKSKKKAKIIEDLLKETGQPGENHFNQLIEKSESYLNKLLTVVRAL
jgi:hypothetical protein